MVTTRSCPTLYVTSNIATYAVKINHAHLIFYPLSFQPLYVNQACPMDSDIQIWQNRSRVILNETHRMLRTQGQFWKVDFGALAHLPFPMNLHFLFHNILSIVCTLKWKSSAVTTTTWVLLELQKKRMHLFKMSSKKDGMDWGSKIGSKRPYESLGSHIHGATKELMELSSCHSRLKSMYARKLNAHYEREALVKTLPLLLHQINHSSSRARKAVSASAEMM